VMRVKVALIIQARMAPVRLPGKSMTDLAREPLLSRIIERILRCQSLDHIILAISTSQPNNCLESLGKKHGILVYRGSENNVLSRFIGASNLVGAELIVGFPADNVARDPTEIDRIVEFHKSLCRPGFSTNICEVRGSGYPDGIGAEFFDRVLLEQAYQKQKCPKQQEHVHLNFYDCENDSEVDNKWCPVASPNCPTAFARPDIILDVNTPSELDAMRAMYEYLTPLNLNFSIQDVIEWYDDVSKRKEWEGAALYRNC
jgi:spore coat polysaccharide biosynthesis protein SpsF